MGNYIRRLQNEFAGWHLPCLSLRGCLAVNSFTFLPFSILKHGLCGLIIYQDLQYVMLICISYCLFNSSAKYRYSPISDNMFAPSIVHVYFHKHLYPGSEKRLRRFISLAYQTARDRDINPKEIFIRQASLLCIWCRTAT